jgi:hypothetical protein
MLAGVKHPNAADLEAGLADVRASPADAGRVELIVRRPAVDEREVLDVGVLHSAVGLVGDTWPTRASSSTEDGSANPARQLTLMNARAAQLVSGGVERWSLAGDQLYVDFDLSVDNVPAGSRLAVGSAVIELTDQPHLGCVKFSGRFGPDALRFVNSPVGRQLRLRGANARVVVDGTVRIGDEIRKC